MSWLLLHGFGFFFSSTRFRQKFDRDFRLLRVLPLCVSRCFALSRSFLPCLSLSLSLLTVYPLTIYAGEVVDQQLEAIVQRFLSVNHRRANLWHVRLLKKKRDKKKRKWQRAP